MALLIKTDGTTVEVTPRNKVFTLDELYEHVGCQMVELITLADGRLMWLDEESKLAPRSEWKPVNLEATRLLQEAGGIPGDVVLGDVLVTSRKETD